MILSEGSVPDFLSDVTTEAVEFYRPDAIPEIVLIGYEKQITAGLSLGLHVCYGGFKTVFLFGVPGTGKGVFPQALAYILNEKHSCNFSFVKLSCERLLLELGTTAAIDSFFISFNNYIKENKRIIVVLDELESLVDRKDTMYFSNNVMKLGLYSLLSNLPETVMVFGISNYPYKVDDTLMQRFCIPIYFDITTFEIIDQIISTYLEDSRHEEISKKLIDEMGTATIFPISSEVIFACTHLKNRGSEIESLTVDEIVHTLMQNISPISSHFLLKEYQEEMKRLIELSEKYTIPYWSNTQSK